MERDFARTVDTALDGDHDALRRGATRPASASTEAAVRIESSPEGSLRVVVMSDASGEVQRRVP